MAEQYFRDTWVEIHLDNISKNIKTIKQSLAKDVEIIAVVKANGYGHGALQASKEALQAGASKLAVSLLDEALSLRENGITAPIMMLGSSRPEDVRIAVENDVILSVFQKEWLEKAQSFLADEDLLKIQFKIDSGMGRIGIRDEEDLLELEQIAANDDRIQLVGIYTHFSTADEEEQLYFKQQLNRFNELVNLLETKPLYKHSSNSAAALRFPETHMDAVRLGIAMYGLSPSKATTDEMGLSLLESFTLHTKLIHVKQLRENEKISYGGEYTTSGNEWIGTIPIGYADGWLRSLTGQDVLVEGQRVKIVGRICMDQCMIKLPKYYPVGTKVTLIGTENGKTISINEIAEKIGTINYEIPCIISNRVPRLYKKCGSIIETNNSLLKYNNKIT